MTRQLSVDPDFDRVRHDNGPKLEPAREALQLVLLERVEERLGVEREGGRVTADRVTQTIAIVRRQVRPRLALIDEAEPGPRPLICQVRMTSTALLEKDPGGTVLATTPFHGCCATGPA